MRTKILMCMVGFLLIGIAIPKLTVRDTVPVEAGTQDCIAHGLAQHYDNPFERIALLFGASRAVRTGYGLAEVESFTLFRLPLGVLRGQADRLGVICNPGFPEDTMTRTLPPPLRDGVYVDWLGEFRDSRAQDGLKAFSSKKLGISFSYPADYLLFEREGEDEGNAYHNLIIGPERGIREAIARIAPGEGPPVIHFSFHHEPTLAVANIYAPDYLEQWIGANRRWTNFDPSDAAQSGVLVPATVTGVSALTYYTSGLFDYEYVVFTYGEWVVIASAAYLDENTPRDFETVLSSFRFASD